MKIKMVPISGANKVKTIKRLDNIIKSCKESRSKIDHILSNTKHNK